MTFSLAISSKLRFVISRFCYNTESNKLSFLNRWLVSLAIFLSSIASSLRAHPSHSLSIQRTQFLSHDCRVKWICFLAARSFTSKLLPKNQPLSREPFYIKSISSKIDTRSCLHLPYLFTYATYWVNTHTHSILSFTFLSRIYTTGQKFGPSMPLSMLFEKRHASLFHQKNMHKFLK